MLGIAKSNLTLISNSLLKENLIEKKKDEIDKRNIVYNITDKGKEKVNKIVSKINVYLNNQQKFKNNAEEINKYIDIILQYLSK